MLEKYLKLYLNAPEDVDIWYCELKGNVVDDLLEECISFLSEEDLASISVYRIPSLVSKAIVTKGLTRKILSSYMNGISPQNLRIYTTCYGKPYLDTSVKISFSLSHCSNAFVIAVSRKFELGIDIEDICGQSYWSLATAVLSGNELEMYMGADEKHKESMFLSFWTRKEAYVKCIGTGLIDNLSGIDTSNFLSKKIILMGNIFQCFSIDILGVNCVSHLVVNEN